MNAYSGHMYKQVKEGGGFVHVKMHFKSNQHNEVLTNAEADEPLLPSHDS